MDKKLHEYPNRKPINLQDSQTSFIYSPSGSNLSQTASAAVDKRNKKRKKAKSELYQHGSRNIWRNLSNMFAKPSGATCVESIDGDSMKEKYKGSTFRRLTAIFKHQKSGDAMRSDVITPISNIGVSPIGYQAIVSETKFPPSEEKEIAMAIQLPTGSKAENVAVIVELEALKKDESLTDDSSDEGMVMKCSEETESKTVFTGILKVPPYTDLSKLANMPLYIVDSDAQLMLKPGAEMSCRKLIRPSKDMLLSDDENYTIDMGTIKIKVRVEKSKEPDKSGQQSTNSVNSKNSTENDLMMNITADEIGNREEITNKEAPTSKPRIADTINVLDEVSALAHIEDIGTVAETENEKETSYALAELRNVNESENHVQAIIAGIRNLLNESEEFAVANAIVDETLDIVKASSSKYLHYRPADNYYNEELEEDGRSSTGYNEDRGRKTSTEKFEVQQSRIPRNYALVEKSLEWENSHYPSPTRNTMQDSSTQYSNSYFTTDKEVDAQYSLLLTNYGIFNDMHKYSLPVPSSSQTLLLRPSNHGNFINKLHQTSNSYESSETVMPDSTTSATTAYSSTLFSDFSTCYENDLKVPLNSPMSATDIQDIHNEIKYVQNVLDLSVSNQHMNKNDFCSTVPSFNVVDRITPEEASHKYVNYSSTEEELYLTDFDVSSKDELKSEQEAERNSKQDKTLDLLQEVRLKLETYLLRTSQYKKVDKIANQNLLNWCELVPNYNNLEGPAKKVTDVRNAGVSCDNVFNPYEYNNEEMNKRCYEDDDEYYESKRKNVRRYFQNDNMGLLMEHDDIKKNFDFYLIGDNLNRKVDLTSTAYQAYPLITNNKLQVRSVKSQAEIKLEESYGSLQGLSTSQTTTFPSMDRKVNYNLTAANSVSSKLEAELNTLQQMYDSMCSHMKFLLEFDHNAIPSTSKGSDSQSTLKSRTIENISDGLTSNFHELKYCLSTINQILAKSTSSLQNINTTLPSTWELFPIASDIFRNNSPKGNQSKRIDSLNASKNTHATISTTLEPFPTVSGDHSPKESLTKQIQLSSSSKNMKTIATTAFESFPTVSELLKNHPPNAQQHQPLTSLKNVDRLMQNILEPFSAISGLFGDHLFKANQPHQIQSLGSTNMYTVLPTTFEPFRAVSDVFCDHSPKDHQTLYIPRSRSKNIYTVLPTTLEPTSTISDLLREHSPKELQTKRVQSSSSNDINSVTLTTVDPSSTISDLLWEQSLEDIHAKQVKELFPTVSELLDDHSDKDNQPKQVLPSNSFENFDNITPNSTELFPTVCNLFWDYSIKSSQTKLAQSTSSSKNVYLVTLNPSQPLLTVSNLLCDGRPKEIEESCDSSSERSKTYFAMESEIERTIKELLKESEDIKEAVILNGGKENAEPPFSVQYLDMLNEGDPLLMCKRIMEDVVNSATGLETSIKETKVECEGPREDVKHILDALLEEINKTEIFVDDPLSIDVNKSKKSLKSINLVYDTSLKDPGEKYTNIQIGDANNEPTSSKFSNIMNECLTCFCSTAAFIPKIPKTSFSFGESPSTCLEISHSGDGLTIIDEEKEELETSLFFNKLLNLQSDMNAYGNDQNEKNNSSSEEEFSSARDIIGEFKENATVSDMLENSISNENKDKQLQEMSSYKLAHSLQSSPYKHSASTSLMESEGGNNADNSDSEDSSPKPSPKNEDKTAHQSVSNPCSTQTIPKSQKCIQLAKSMNKDQPKNQPSTSKRSPKYTGTTEEEEVMQDIDLTQKLYESSTEREYFIFDKSSEFTQKSSQGHARSRQVCDSSSEEEIAVNRAISKPRSKKKEENKEMLEKRKREEQRKKDKQIVVIKPKTLLISDSDSDQFTEMPQPLINRKQGLMPINSGILLKPAQALLDIPEQMRKEDTDEPPSKPSTAAKSGKTKTIAKAVSTSEYSSGNGMGVSDTEYEGDHETLQFDILTVYGSAIPISNITVAVLGKNRQPIKLPNTKQRFKSIQELNSPDEIAKIEHNLRENNKLQKPTRVVLVTSETSSQLEYEDSSFDSENHSRSDISINTQQERSGKINIIDVDDNARQVTPQSLVPPTVKPSPSRSTI